MFLVSLCLFLNNFSANAFAISARSAIVMDANSGRILYSHNANAKMGMASTTKIMTAITALENADINSIATVSSNAYGVEGSSMYLVKDEKLTLEDLLWGLMLVSGNDAATAIAEHVAKTTDAFAELMNRTALEIGAVDSHFTNPHGLSDDNHYTTAHDLAKITAYALENPKFREIVSTRTKSIPWKDHEYNRHLVNHNKFLTQYDGCIGVKTGFTKATGRCLVTAVEKNGLLLICVTLNAPDDWNDHRTLYDNAFSEYSPYKIKTASETVMVAEIKKGSVDAINLVAKQDICIPLKSGEESNITITPSSFENLQAPIKKGDTLGKLTVLINGNHCGEYPLVASDDVELKKVIFKASSGNFGISLKKVFNAWIHCFD